MDIDNCNPLNIYLNLDTNKIECLPGVLIPPAGYSQILPEATVRPKNWWVKYALIAAAALILLKK